VRADRGVRTTDVAVLGVDADPVYAVAGNCSGVTRPREHLSYRRSENEPRMRPSWKYLPAMLRSLLPLS
jgi:hypothetical protein